MSYLRRHLQVCTFTRQADPANPDAQIVTFRAPLLGDAPCEFYTGEDADMRTLSMCAQYLFDRQIITAEEYQAHVIRIVGACVKEGEAA